MIVELFGAPAVGKTTFARALAADLRARGHSVELFLSHRPAETMQASTGPAPLTATVQRLARPALELWEAGRPPGKARRPGIASELLGILPAKNPVWSVRLHQYVTRLERSWELAKRHQGVVVFDQAFVQAVCSLVLLGRSPTRALASEALALAPHADLAVKLEAPRSTLLARLDVRRRNQGRLERLFELDAETNLRSVAIVDLLQELLLGTGQDIECVQCADDAPLTVSLAGVARRLGERNAGPLRTLVC